MPAAPQLITSDIQLSSLVDFVDAAALAARESDEESVLFSLKEEILLSKHVITFFRPTIDRSIKLVQAMQKKIEGLDTNDITREDITAMAVREQALLDIGDKLQESLQKTARLVKQATEIEAIKANRLDSVQLLAVLQQIPTLINDAIRIFILDKILDPLQKTLEEKLAPISDPHSLETLKKIRSIPLFGRMKEMVLTEMMAELHSSLDNTIREATVVPHNGISSKADGNNNNGAGSGVTLDVVQKMMGTVPKGPTGATG